MKSYSNCFNAREKSIDLTNLFSSNLCLSPSNDHISNLKDYGDFAEENKQYDSSDNQHDNNQPNDAKLEKRRLIESFHQVDLTEIQVINKNSLSNSKAINENKGIQRRPGSGSKRTIIMSTFEIIKKCFLNR